MDSSSTVVVGALICALTAAACTDNRPPRSYDRALIVLGIDGMDPVLLDQAMRDGRAPNLAALAKQGVYTRLATSNPPQSPVAWSHYTTGGRSDLHGIYDFVHRDPTHMAPYLSTSRTTPADVMTIGSLAIPLSGGGTKLLREGESYWEGLAREGVPTTAVKVPANYPPPGGGYAEVLAGMGTPDLLGTPGTFQVFTSDPELIAGGNLSGGLLHRLAPVNAQSSRSKLVGPADPANPSSPLTLEVEVTVDQAQPVAVLRFGDLDLLLQQGEWSEWTPVVFDGGLIVGDIPGMVRVFLKSVQPYVTVYISPINLDPMDPKMRVSAPPEFAAELAADAGRYYTQGMPEDTKALAAGVLSDAEFLAQADLVFNERLRMLDRELERFDGGVLFFYFSSIDQVSHVFWRAFASDAPPEVAQYSDVIPSLYERIDGVVGEVRRRHPEATLLVMSDHGFSPYTRKVHLNLWLAQQGYLAVRDGPPAEGSLGHIDWARTQAYALGLNQLFLNVAGREAEGVVPLEEREILLDRLERELLRWRDPETGARVITRVYRPDPSAYPDRAPDLLIGYNRGYRSADESAVGQLGPAVLVDNVSKWSGDHCMDPSHVPGILVSSVPLDLSMAPALLDMAPTIMGFFDMMMPSEAVGRSLWRSE